MQKLSRAKFPNDFPAWTTRHHLSCLQSFWKSEKKLLRVAVGLPVKLHWSSVTLRLKDWHFGFLMKILFIIKVRQLRTATHLAFQKLNSLYEYNQYLVEDKELKRNKPSQQCDVGIESKNPACECVEKS